MAEIVERAMSVAALWLNEAIVSLIRSADGHVNDVGGAALKMSDKTRPPPFHSFNLKKKKDKSWPVRPGSWLFWAQKWRNTRAKFCQQLIGFNCPPPGVGAWRWTQTPPTFSARSPRCVLWPPLPPVGPKGPAPAGRFVPLVTFVQCAE